MSDEDDDLEAYWADVRSKERRTSKSPIALGLDAPPRKSYPRPEPSMPRSGVSPELAQELRRQMLRAPLPQPPSLPVPPALPLGTINQLLGALEPNGEMELDVQVGLFTQEGEVTGAGYARIPSRITISRRIAYIGRNLHFPPAADDWGTVLTMGIFFRDAPLFWIDLANTTTLRAGDTININATTIRMDR